MKWQDYSKNSWEPEDNLNGCEQLIENYEAQQARQILSVRQTENGIEYILQYKDNFPNRIVSSAEAVAKWSSLVLNFLEQSARNVSQNESQVERRVSFITENPGIGNPIGVTCEYFVQKLTLLFPN